jgi:hypothetical protein
LRNDNVLCRLAFWIRKGACVFDLGDYVHALDDVSEDDVLAIQMRRSALRRDDEELAAIGVRASYSQCTSGSVVEDALTRCSTDG